MTFQPSLNGLWLPLITPFKDGELDEVSLRRLIQHYARKNLGGIILAATTGEGQTIDETELEIMVAITAEEIGKCSSELSLYLGLSGNDPRKMCEQLGVVNKWLVDGYLISTPHYLRPSQEGLKQHFRVLAQNTERPILIYNIPYRTGVNMTNETMLELATLPNIVGVKDCCGSPDQSHELLRLAPADFAVFTGEDPFFYNSLVHGSPGAIVTGAHVLVDVHLDIIAKLKDGEQAAALQQWNQVAHIPNILFSEPSPAPLKHWLWRAGLIDSPEVRLPMVPISNALAKAIDEVVASKKY